MRFATNGRGAANISGRAFCMRDSTPDPDKDVTVYTGYTGSTVARRLFDASQHGGAAIGRQGKMISDPFAIARRA
jgi:hypothetical protein